MTSGYLISQIGCEQALGFFSSPQFVNCSREKDFAAQCVIQSAIRKSRLLKNPGTSIVTLDVINALRYYLFMIRSFASRETEKLFRRQFSKKLPNDIQRRARIKLEILDAVERLDDLKIPPSNRLEKLSGNRESQYSIRINDQWRICFEWRNGDVYQVEIVDYH